MRARKAVTVVWMIVDAVLTNVAPTTMNRVP
jgi:hypothetical protein